MNRVAANPIAFEGTVQCAGREHRVWLFRLHSGQMVLAVEGAGALAFTPGEKTITGADLIIAGCDLMLAESVLAEMQTMLTHSPAPLRAIENAPEGATNKNNKQQT